MKRHITHPQIAPKTLCNNRGRSGLDQNKGEKHPWVLP